jgi:hypothetical protein
MNDGFAQIAGAFALSAIRATPQTGHRQSGMAFTTRTLPGTDVVRRTIRFHSG